MKRISVDIGGTFTDCFVAWDDQYIQSKALTTKQNLALGFNNALEQACTKLKLSPKEVLSGVDSVRYATTLGTNALIEGKGPRVGALVTAGFEDTIPLSRGRGYGEGLDGIEQNDLSSADRPDPIVNRVDIRSVRERIDYKGDIITKLDEDDLRKQIRSLMDNGIQALVVCLTNGVENPMHELRVQDVFLEEYPAHMLGSIPVLLSHQVGGRKGEYVRASSTILDAFLHQVMYHSMSSLELNLRELGYTKPMLLVHNSGGMAQLNSTDALQTVHSGPVSGIHASEHLADEAGLGNVIATDMGGTSFDIGMVVKGGIKYYDFFPTIERWMVSVPMVHLVTLGAGGGSIAKYNSMYGTLQLGPESAGSDPGPACYDRGGMYPTVTDADLLLGYLDPDNYSDGKIKLNKSRAEMVVEDELCDDLDLEIIDAAKLIKAKVDEDMANKMFTELRAKGYEPNEFTMLAYGGNGPLHCCGIAKNLGISRILAPPFSSVFSACGAGSMNQLHIHEKTSLIIMYDSTSQNLYSDYQHFNDLVKELEQRGRADLLRQDVDASLIRHRLELDMRYGNQMAETAVVCDIKRLESVQDVFKLIEQFSISYGNRYGEGSQAPEAGIRINTIRVASYVELPVVSFKDINKTDFPANEVEPDSIRDCHFIGFNEPISTPCYSDFALTPGTQLTGPAIITTSQTAYLVEPGWKLTTTGQGAVWFDKID